MSDTDNIETTPADVRASRKAAHDAKATARKERMREVTSSWRDVRRRSEPPSRLAVGETLLLCLLDVQTLPPSKRGARGEVIQDVLRQAHRTLTARGHPRVGEEIWKLVESLRERLRTETWHHPVRHTLLGATPADTPVTPKIQPPYPADRITDGAQDPAAGEQA